MNYQKLAIAAVAAFSVILIVIVYALVTDSAGDQDLLIVGLHASPACFSPGSGTAEISYSLQSSGSAIVRIEIVNSAGEVYRAICLGTQGPGRHVITWDGRDDRGGPVPDGNFTVRTTASALPGGGAADTENVSVANASIGVVVDWTPPEIIIAAPGDGRTYGLNQAVMVQWLASDEGSGLESVSGTEASGAYLDTATLGDHEFRVTAADRAGNTAESTLLYFVDDPSKALEYQHAEVRINATSPVVYDAEIADTSEKIYKGLMYRTALAGNAGMLFVFSGDQDHYFWMENTRLPLDLIYISTDFTVVGVREDAEPGSTDQIVPPAPCKFVLEVNAGECRTRGIRAGDDVEIST